jgi:hypothetical protein
VLVKRPARKVTRLIVPSGLANPIILLASSIARGERFAFAPPEGAKVGAFHLLTGPEADDHTGKTGPCLKRGLNRRHSAPRIVGQGTTSDLSRTSEFEGFEVRQTVKHGKAQVGFCAVRTRLNNFARCSIFLKNSSKVMMSIPASEDRKSSNDDVFRASFNSL